MKLKIINIILICFCVFIFSSCSKSVDNNHWHAEITENKAATLQDVFLQNGSEKLIDIVASNDVVKMSNYNKFTYEELLNVDTSNLDKAERKKVYNLRQRRKPIDKNEEPVIKEVG